MHLEPKFPEFSPSSESLQDLTPKIIQRVNGRIPEATVPIECTELVGELLREIPRDPDKIWSCQRKYQEKAARDRVVGEMVCSETSVG
jgi:hypothetical protein